MAKSGVEMKGLEVIVLDDADAQDLGSNAEQNNTENDVSTEQINANSASVAEQNYSDSRLIAVQSNAGGMVLEQSTTDNSENPATEYISTPMEVDEIDSTSSLDVPINLDDNEAVNSATVNVKVGTDFTLGTQDYQVSSSSMMPDNTENDNSVDFALEANAETREQHAEAYVEVRIIPETNTGCTQTREDESLTTETATNITEAEKITQSESSTEDLRDFTAEIYAVSNYTEEEFHDCKVCSLHRKPSYILTNDETTMYVCDDYCLANYKDTKGNGISILTDAEATIGFPEAAFSRKCCDCSTHINDEANVLVLYWGSFEFCNDVCLAAYQKRNGLICVICKKNVREYCIGKYSLRFGNNMRQFCSGSCLDYFKKSFRFCSYCQKEMSDEGFLASVTEKKIYKDFCSRECLNKYKVLKKESESPPIEGTCSVCLKDQLTIAYDYRNKQHKFCGEPCFVAFRFVKNISASKCNMCEKYFDNMLIAEFGMYYEDALRIFCSDGCQNMYITTTRKVVSCSWCKVSKYNHDMIKRKSDSGTLYTCSLLCLNQHLISIAKDNTCWIVCDQCHKAKQPLYQLTMSDASIRNFCSYSCVAGFQNRFPKTGVTLSEPAPISCPQRFVSVNTSVGAPVSPTIPIITNVQSLANVSGSPPHNRKRLKQKDVVPQTIIKTQIRQQVIVKPPRPVMQRNVSTMCRVTMMSKATNCNLITTADKTVQTDAIKKKIIPLPIPVPVHVPLPMRMYSQPFPVPFPFPLPVPVPIFVPTSRNSAKGIMKEMKAIQSKMPSNPLEAEILIMADMAAGGQKVETTDSETEGEEPTEAIEDPVSTPEQCDGSTSIGEDDLQMAIKIAAELNQPGIDLEGALAASTVTASEKPDDSASAAQAGSSKEEQAPVQQRQTRGRGGRGSRGRRPTRQSVSLPDTLLMNVPEPPSEVLEKPDANMCLKYTFGVNAWKQWVVTKNAELEQSSSKAKLFKTEILQLTSDELNYSLCLFVKEVRKPNGQEYAPDTIYYLCLGIQQYLYENNRIDNIFCDPYYEKFTDCLDEVVKKFSVLFNESNYIITRVEEEHLWESKQLGAQSPHVLLSTLMFFNTKHFNLTTVGDHLQLSFSHIMKHWKRNPVVSGSQKFSGARNVLLRFYPPQTPGGTAIRRKKVYEQHENEGNPFRCPVKLYEFYLSKCPESVKTRNDVFYLQPERSCVPESPVWYSTTPLPQQSLEKMLHRVKMVKEVNVALLST